MSIYEHKAESFSGLSADLGEILLRRQTEKAEIKFVLKLPVFFVFPNLLKAASLFWRQIWVRGGACGLIFVNLNSRETRLFQKSINTREEIQETRRFFLQIFHDHDNRFPALPLHPPLSHWNTVTAASLQGDPRSDPSGPVLVSNLITMRRGSRLQGQRRTPKSTAQISSIFHSHFVAAIAKTSFPEFREENVPRW